MKLDHCAAHTGSADLGMSCYRIRHDDGRIATPAEIWDAMKRSRRDCEIANNGFGDNGMADLDFIEFPKMARLSREIIITEKIDGTSATVYIADDGMTMKAGSRTRWITPEDDNHGFAHWCEEHHDELLTLGPGWHRGEWWGQGIQRGYYLKEKRFSLFNTPRWALAGTEPKPIKTQDPRITKMQDVLPACCHLVPVLWAGVWTALEPHFEIKNLEVMGSRAAPGFMRPEGIVVYHTAGNVGFKMTLGNDGAKGGVS